MRLRDMPNIGVVAEKNLIEAGIPDAEALRVLGSRKAFLLVREKSDPGACLAFLYGLEGAVQGIPKKLLPDEDKESLRRFFKEQ